jgi:hypothetical protein
VEEIFEMEVSWLMNGFPAADAVLGNVVQLANTKAAAAGTPSRDIPACRRMADVSKCTFVLSFRGRRIPPRCITGFDLEEFKSDTGVASTQVRRHS